jgi:hypothetical protein
MLHYCSHCHTKFVAKRKDKVYCSNSCKQMAFIRRQNSAEDLTPENFQNVKNLKRQLIDSSIAKGENYQYTENVKPSTNLYNDSPSKKVEFIDFEDESIEGFKSKTSTDKQTVNEFSNANDGLNAQTVDKSRVVVESEYAPVRCLWIDKLYERFKLERKSFSEKEYQVEWVGIRYRSLLECLLSLSRMNIIEWTDLAELTNSFTSLISSQQFKDSPTTYSFKKEIVLLRDKLKTYCIETKGEDWIQFRLKVDTKKELLFQRFVLAQHFKRLTFDQLQQDFKNEKMKVNQKRIEEQNTEPEKKSWQVRFRELKAKRDS